MPASPFPDLTPVEAQFLLRFLMPQLKSEQAITVKVISAVPAGCEDYKPHERSMTALALSRHIALAEIWFLDAVLAGRFADDFPRPAEGEQFRTCHDVARWFEVHSGQRMTRLDGLCGEDLAARVNWIGLREDPAVHYLNIALRHSVHHRGQLSAYLRPMGAKIPAIYVESADEPYPPDDGGDSPDGPQGPPAF